MNNMKKLFFSIGVFILSLSLFSQELHINDGKVYVENQLYSGEKISYFENSTNIKEVKNYLNGLEHGKSSVYYKNGQLKEERYWDAGQKIKIWINWNESGKIVAEAGYNANKKHGNWNIWNDKGQKLFEMHYSHGSEIGIWRQWNDQGILLMEKDFNQN